ncbi:hypothetical protein [Methanobacterium ferruginis]|uniref:hypothetical protein n=1 Tax=Methanobacterium ferruginis TaxID=710191 RepID=UPI002573A10E|nr:hypothetical protein [Methanobacterium ferruginis]BDZ68002.1 hypothetical protein GCM10025860_14500 [Methanobacterium ferruginis]
MKKSLWILMLSFLLCSVVYADSGPNIEANQAKAIAQDYLNSHDLSYTALTPNIETDWKAKVKVIATGEVKWIPYGNAKQDAMEETGKYEMITDAWIVQVQDKNGNSMGTIYINPDSGKIISVNLKGTQDTGTGTGGTNTGGDLSYNGTGSEDENSGGILGTLQDFFDGITSFFQQLWTSIFGGS